MLRFRNYLFKKLTFYDRKGKQFIGNNGYYGPNFLNNSFPFVLQTHCEDLSLFCGSLLCACLSLNSQSII